MNTNDSDTVTKYYIWNKAQFFRNNPDAPPPRKDIPHRMIRTLGNGLVEAGKLASRARLTQRVDGPPRPRVVSTLLAAMGMAAAPHIFGVDNDD